ncbi:MAG TPA: dATP/dGTP diphosphohydrolase domain-containing protein [Alphaproteobacteria bacterium]|nr:dATP/dGTP diphosphohydrolase domain-containing protein [Alphaproteobacteria bacterium]
MTKKMHKETAAKYDKPPVYSGVLARFPRAIRELAKVSRFGAQKHGVPVQSRSFLDMPQSDLVFKDAMARHLLDEVIDGAVNEEDGGLLHSAQRAWNALADLEVRLSAPVSAHTDAESAPHLQETCECDTCRAFRAEHALARRAANL